jgi:methylated-DNA-[protein]-cysteine S-methyltransferase
MAQERFFVEEVPTPIGALLLLSDAEGVLRALDWADCAARMHRLLRLHYGDGGVRLEERADVSVPRRAVETYIEGEISALDGVPVKTGGTAFQRTVWAALRAVPAGETESYGQLAARLGRPAASRAVGMANGANPVGLVVPCHRVIGADGSLTGYAGGVARKRWLLEHEGKKPL